MSRKQLEIQLTQSIRGFSKPKIEFEQYQTPPRVAANLLHIAWTRDHIENCEVIDLCAGTGILGIGAALLGANSTLIEIDPDAYTILQQNIADFDLPITTELADVIDHEFTSSYDTAVLNPPFGIQQKSRSDMDFVKKAADIAQHIYSIHDGSSKNQERLPKLFDNNDLEIVEAYLEDFPLTQSYPWHTSARKIHQVLIIHSKS